MSALGAGLAAVVLGVPLAAVCWAAVFLVAPWLAAIWREDVPPALRDVIRDTLHTVASAAAAIVFIALVFAVVP